MEFHTLIKEFKDYMENQGLLCINSIIPDGKIHRFHVAGDKLHSINGWYFLNACFKRGAFGNWRTGEKYKWSGHPSSSSAEYTRYKQHLNNFLISQQDVQKKSCCSSKRIMG
jgi:putative DNA primase/helicase